MTLEELYLQHSRFAWDVSAFSQMYTDFRERTPDERADFVLAANALSYRDYLRTVFWGILRGYVLHQNQRCSNCRTRSALQVHHVRYDHRGEEYANLSDLTVLCKRCHQECHGLATTDEIVKAAKRRQEAPNFPYSENDSSMEPILDVIRAHHDLLGRL